MLSVLQSLEQRLVVNDSFLGPRTLDLDMYLAYGEAGSRFPFALKL